MNLANFKIVTPILLFSCSAFAGISSKCLDQINLALNNGSDSAPIPVECQYYKISDLEKPVQTKIIERLKKSKDTVTKDSKLSNVLGSLRNANNPEPGVSEVNENKPNTPQPETLILKSATTEESPPTEVVTPPETDGKSCLPDHWTLGKPVEDQHQYDWLDIPSGVTYDVDQIDHNLVITLLFDTKSRWCPVDKNLKPLSIAKLREAEDQVRYEETECAKSVNKKDGPWHPGKITEFDRVGKAGKCRWKYIAAQFKIPKIALDLKYFVPSRYSKGK